MLFYDFHLDTLWSGYVLWPCNKNYDNTSVPFNIALSSLFHFLLARFSLVLLLLLVTRHHHQHHAISTSDCKHTPNIEHNIAEYMIAGNAGGYSTTSRSMANGIQNPRQVLSNFSHFLDCVCVSHTLYHSSQL